MSNTATVNRQKTEPKKGDVWSRNSNGKRVIIKRTSGPIMPSYRVWSPDTGSYWWVSAKMLHGLYTFVERGV